MTRLPSDQRSEDEAGACEVASTILKQARSEVRTAKSACEALEVMGEWLADDRASSSIVTACIHLVFAGLWWVFYQFLRESNAAQITHIQLIRVRSI